MLRVVRVSGRSPREEGEQITVSGGSREARGVLSLSKGEWVLHVRPQEMRALGLDEAQQVALWQDRKSWRLGPYIGIMTVKRPLLQHGFSSLSGRRDNYTGLARIGREQGAVVFVFAAENMNFKDMTVLGYGRRGAGHWVAREYPWPDVVYNRVPDRKSEGKRAVSLVKRHFTLSGGALFNPAFLNKWNLHVRLSSNEAISRYIPDTRLFRSEADLSTMLKKHALVYLKPVSSFAGQGILQIRKTQNAFVLRYREGNDVQDEYCEDIRGLLQAVSQRKKAGSYLVQQGLSLAKYRGCIFDARALVQKTADGSWDLTGIGIRVAKSGGITTHVPCGGHIASIGNVLQDVFDEKPDTPDGVYSRVRKLALEFAPAIEKSMRHHFGEMSMDIGIELFALQRFFFK